MADFKTLDLRIWRGSQDWNYEELLELASPAAPPHRLRVVIHSDSYDRQSYARVERWDGA